MLTSRFSTRTIGVELEIPEFSDELETLRDSYDWDFHDDGSIPDDGKELVSPPICGEAISHQIGCAYDICKSESVRTEHVSCGMHVHVDARDIFAGINKHATPDEISQRVELWGSVMACLTRLFVGPGRNGTHFATGGFAIRDSCPCDPGSLKKSRRVDYPTVAIRENTFEFRIFPSTTRCDYTLARVALCQAGTDWIQRYMTLTAETYRKHYRRLEAPLRDPHLWEEGDPSSSITGVLKELKVSEQDTAVLLEIFTKFRSGNSAVLPAVWEQEHEAVRKQMKYRQQAYEAFLATPPSSPASLRDYLAVAFGGCFPTIRDLEQQVVTIGEN